MKWMIVGLLVGVYIFETVVSLLNRKHSLKPIPNRVRDVYDAERYKKWLAYFLEVQRFSVFQQGFNILILVIPLFGACSRLERAISAWTTSPILQSLYFLGIVQTLMFVLDVPLKIYRTFSIEERHWFNLTTT